MKNYIKTNFLYIFRGPLLVLFCFYSSNAGSQTQVNIYFEKGSDKVSVKDKEVLRRLAENLSEKEVAVSLRGYTDTTGTIELNRNLAIKRELAVASVLSEYGVDINSKRVNNYCDSGNLSDVEISNAENRRVSVIIDELTMYPTKSGMIIMAPKHIKLRVIDQYYQRDLCSK